MNNVKSRLILEIYKNQLKSKLKITIINKTERIKRMLKKILENKKLRSDIILVGVLLIVSLSVLLFMFLTKEEGAIAEVYVNNEKVAEYPLSIDGVYYLNGGTNVLVVENGEAYMREANCPDKFSKNGCVNTGKISYVGQKIVCLPNKIIVEIVGEGEGIVDV